MKNIRLKEMHLINFKGIPSLDIVFNEKETTILGANGSGKTTTFDAFTWLLFGKDSFDRKEFSIKTYDKDGNIIPRLPHEVSATLIVDNEEFTLRRSYKEVWSKERGGISEYLSAHKTECFINDVPLAVKEYEKRVSEICSDQLFKLITNPEYFTSQRPDVQRSFLFSLAGEFSEEEIAGDNADFNEVLSMLTGKSIDDLNKEIAAKKKAINDEVKSIPLRIDEQQRSLIPDRDWDAINSEIARLNGVLETLNNADKAMKERSEVTIRAKQELYNKIADINTKIATIKLEIRSNFERNVMAEKSEYDKSVMELSMKQKSLSAANEKLRSTMDTLNTLIQQRDEMRNQFRAIQAEKFTLEVCPTCGRSFEDEPDNDYLEGMREKFNNSKAIRIENNRKQGKALTAQITSYESSIEEQKANIATLEQDIAAIGEIKPFVKPTTNIDLMADSDKRIIECKAEIDDLRHQIAEIVDPVADTDNSAEKADCVSQINTLVAELALKKQRDIQLGRINELMNQQRNLADALAELEYKEAKVLEYNKERVRFIENRINSLFRKVRFKLFDTQLNGNTVECCEATVDGIPFSTCSKSERINMGMDIINAICSAYAVSAPIFVDNRESIVNLFIPDNSQVINLKVDDNSKTLTIF